MTHATEPRDVTLGIFAGGRAKRLGGLDKAWLRRDGVPQVLRIARRFAPQVGAVLIAANRDRARYREAGLTAIADRHVDAGPLGGLEALAAACATPWLFTLPVDIVDASDCLLRSLVAAGGQGAYAEDDDGIQPLVALWPVQALRPALEEALSARRLAVQALQRRLAMAALRCSGIRFGNLNTPEDLAAAGIEPP